METKETRLIWHYGRSANLPESISVNFPLSRRNVSRQIYFVDVSTGRETGFHLRCIIMQSKFNDKIANKGPKIENDANQENQSITRQ